MATSSMVPYSNPAGNNQTTPALAKPAAPVAVPTSATPILAPGGATGANPFAPPTVPTTTNPSSTTTGLSTSINSPELFSQLQDIYGSGVGGSLNTFLDSIQGTNSATLQQFIQSLQPQEARLDANLGASLGAAGAGMNSSVGALGEANLKAQEFATISGESANLLQSQENLTAQILGGIAPTAAQQVVDSSPLSIFGQVLGDIGGAVGNVAKFYA